MPWGELVQRLLRPPAMRVNFVLNRGYTAVRLDAEGNLAEQITGECDVAEGNPDACG